MPDCQIIAHYFWVALTPHTYWLNMLKALWGSMYVRIYPDFFFILWEWPYFCKQMAAPDFFVFFSEIFLGKPNKYWGEMLYQGAI